LSNIKKIKGEFSNPSVMFDIDDTLIDSITKKKIEPMIKLLNKCIKEDYSIIIITARDVQYTKQTKAELEKNGIKYNLLFLRDPSRDYFHTFKSNIKKLLSEKDIDIVMSIGDQMHDVSGEYSGYYIKLPDHVDDLLFHLNADGNPEEIKL
jgi:hydroxymethylpyrimidine pyrophosphatase-like HAD family hydrolase